MGLFNWLDYRKRYARARKDLAEARAVLAKTKLFLEGHLMARAFLQQLVEGRRCIDICGGSLDDNGLACREAAGGCQRDAACKAFYSGSRTVASLLWDLDCLHERGHLLKGKQGHYCPDWDGLPVDETTPEASCCTCDIARIGRKPPELVFEYQYMPPIG